MLTEIRAVRALIAKHGETLKQYEKAAYRINANEAFQGLVNGRTINKRFKRRMENFVSREWKYAVPLAWREV